MGRGHRGGATQRGGAAGRWGRKGAGPHGAAPARVCYKVWGAQAGCLGPGSPGRCGHGRPSGGGWAALTATWGLRQPLTVAEVQNLLGANLAGLKAEQGNSPVRDWILRQRQDDLDRLGLGLRGGIPNGYLVMDLSFRGGLGGWLGGAGAEPGMAPESLSLHRGPLRGRPPPPTGTSVHRHPGSAPGFDPEVSPLLWTLDLSCCEAPWPPQGDWSSIKGHHPSPQRCPVVF